MKKRILQLCLLAGCFTLPSYAATFTISDGDVSGLISAINIANSNGQADIINLAANGTYILNAINFTSLSPGTTGFAGQRGLPEILNDLAGLDLTINGNGATIQRSTSGPQFGLISTSGQTVFNNIIFRNGNLNGQGAAIFVQFKGNVEVENCKFYNNNAGLDTERGGGAIYTKSLSVLKVTDSYFENNTAVNQGGAISNLLSDMTIINCIFKNNRTTDVVGIDPSGGAIYVDGARGDNGIIIIRNTSFEGNTCINGQGGALFLFPYRNQVVDLIGCTFKNNSSNMGGGVWHQGGGSGGIFDTEYPLTSGIENTTLNFHDCVFDGNTSVTQGGGIWLSRCKMNEIYNLTFKNNVSGLGGGFALLSDRFVTVRNSTFNNNSAGISGAIWPGINARLDIINCTFTSNIASSYGGAMSLPKNDATRPVNITNCTFANNQGNNPGNGQGAAIHSGTENSPNTTVTIKNNIFSNNTVTNNYGVWRDCNGILNDGGNNIFFPAGVGQNCVTTPNFVNPLLGPLANNGGPTQTMALLVGSPAIDAGSGCPTLDQRGGTRINTCDVGAYEYNATLGNDDYNLASQTLKLYPNPAVNGKITVEMPIELKGQNVEILILNLLGTTLNKFLVNGSEANKELNLTGTPAGIYFIAINAGQMKFTSKIIID